MTADTAARPQVLVAPITISPTKPLTPTHVRFLLAVDLLCRATNVLADVTCLYDHWAFAAGNQTVAFWEYLDRVCPELDYRALGENDIGELYVRYHAECQPVPYRRLAPYVERARVERWLHPSAIRILDIWEDHYRLLRLADPELGRRGTPSLPPGDLVALLTAHELCLDGRPLRAPVYLDLTAHGIPLRQVINESGQANYLMCVLGQLIPLVSGYDLVVLMYDRELREDYLLVERILAEFGARVARFEVERVAIDNAVAASRRGGWRGYTMSDLRAQLEDDVELPLGLRLYLTTTLGRGSERSFRTPELSKWLGRARALRERAGAGGTDLVGFLHPLARATGYVDPFRLTARLLTRGAGVPTRELLRHVFD